MTRNEYYRIMGILDKLEDIERQLCEGHLEKNPGDMQRVHESGIYKQALIDVRRNVINDFKRNLKEDIA